jgi:hypothetical protein
VLIDTEISVDRNVIKKEPQKTLHYKNLTVSIQHHVECKNKSDTDKNRQLKPPQNHSEQRTRKAENQGTTENSRIGHCMHALQSTHIKIQNIQHRK